MRAIVVHREGTLKVSVSRRLPLEQASEAHRLLESRATTGKIVLHPCHAEIQD